MLKSFSWKYILYVALFFYICFISISMHEFTKRMDYILHYPVRVSQETREMKTRVLEMQNTVPGLLSTPNLTYEDFVEVFDRQDRAQDISFEKAKQLLQGYPNEIRAAEEAFKDVRAARRKAARLMLGNSSYAKAITVYKDTVEPEVDNLYTALNNLFLCANKIMQNAQADTRRDSRLNIVITIVLGTIIMLAFLYFDKLEKSRNREIVARDKLFNQLSQNVDEVFVIARNADKFEYASSNSQRLIGLDAQKLVASPALLFDFLPADCSQWLRQALNKPAATCAQNCLKEGLEVQVNGRRRYFKLSIHPVGEAGKSNSIITLHDQTEEYEYNQNLTDALNSARAANAAKSSFLSHMSHEIRTPMNAIIGMTTIALSKLDDRQRVEDCLSKIAESSRHLLGLINDVLDMSKIESGKLGISHEAFSLAQSIQSINDLIRPQTEAKKITFEIFQNSEEEHLVGDALRLNQILLNILSNAVKFTPQGGSITLKVQQVKKWNNNVRLRFIISDTGIGISKEFMNRLFKPFEQASTSTASRYGGTGLGMSITFNLINLMGGTISVSSEENKGTAFTVELPFGCSTLTAPDYDSLPQMKVLVVDDDYGTCEHASLLLEKMGMKVEWAICGRDAIDMVARSLADGEVYDVCFIDWKMPHMDGAQTAHRIRQMVGDEILIIIISAYDWSAIEDNARAEGVNDFIAKPFFASTLYDALLSSTRRLGLKRTESQKKEKDDYDFSGKRVLLVEDNEFNSEIAKEFLEMANAQSEHAENGQEAVDKFSASPGGYYDMILMDVQMPVMDGYEATEKIRDSDHPDARRIPILAMTANAFSEDVAHATQAGMDGHIAKPIDIKELYRMLDKHFGKKHS